jgi:short-subunit dehydrogenase
MFGNSHAAPGARVVIITGGSSGIGRCTAALFSRNGWRVGLIARGAAGLESARSELARPGGVVAVAAADVADAAALEDAAARLANRLGPCDVWINGAGNGVFGRFLSVPAEEFCRVTEVTYLGTVNGTRTALRQMLPRDAGAIVNVCSGIAFHGMPLLSSYSGAKHAVRGFTDAIRAELRQDGARVRIGIVFPPAVNTPFFSHAVSHMDRPPRPMRPVYQPEPVADAIFRVATGRRREITVGSVTMLFGLASALFPRLIERAIYQLGYAGQMTSCPRAAALREPTLFAPSPRASGMRGPFDAQARRFSLQAWLARRQVLVPAGVAISVGLVVAAFIR